MLVVAGKPAVLATSVLLNHNHERIRYPNKMESWNGTFRQIAFMLDFPLSMAVTPNLYAASENEAVEKAQLVTLESKVNQRVASG